MSPSLKPPFPSSLRAHACALLVLMLTCSASALAPSPGLASFFISAAHADDGDGDGGDDGGDDGDGGGASGGSGGGAAGGGGGAGSAGSGGAAGAGSGPGGGADIDFEPPEETPAVEAELFLADELLAANPSAAALRRARALGLTVLSSTRAGKLPLTVVRLRLPRGLDAKTARQLLARSDPGVFDLHHLYPLAQQAAGTADCSGPGCDPLRLIGWPEDARNCGRGQTIGIVDTAVDTTHPALTGATVRTRTFVDKERTAAPDEHGTAVAALLVGRAESGHPGIVPRAQLMAAAPFYTLESGNVSAHAAGLISSLDWLIAQGAKVIGMSLAGPHNLVLDAAVQRAAKRGVLIAAAAGNGGRSAPAAYPAAFDQVLAITAISPERRVYWRANQGDYIDYALPGVNLWTAGPASAGKRRSGTSFAVPFMVGMASQGIAQRMINRKQLQEGRLDSLSDLGSPGRDPVFGWGKPRFAVACR